MADGAAPIERFIASLYTAMLHHAPEPETLRGLVARFQASGDVLDLLEHLIAASDEARRSFGAHPPGHFYSPITNIPEALAYLDRQPFPPPETLPGIAFDRARMTAFWEEIAPFAASHPFPRGRDGRTLYWLENPNFGPLDGIVLHAVLRRFRPVRVIEVGSGLSSACILDTVRLSLDGNCAVTLIEPYPETLRAAVPDVDARARLIDRPVQEVALAEFEALGADDVLFIDSSHVVKAGSDVQHELFEILPRLAPGVVVHFHDVFWPFEYPRDWLIDNRWCWNELYALRALLTDNRGWEILAFNHWAALFAPGTVRSALPDWAEAGGGSLWLRKRTASTAAG